MNKISVRENEKIMKFTKKFFCLVSLLLINVFVHTGLSLEEQIELDLFDFDTTISEMDVTTPTAVTRGTVPATIGLLTAADINAQTILQAPLYYRTNPVARKIVVDLPIFQHFNTFNKEETNFDCIPFYSQTFNEQYYKDFDELKDYIDVNQETIVRKLDTETLTRFQVPKLLQLFGKMKLQEHRIGLIFDWTKTRDNWALSIRAPFYYDEHNFYLNPTQRQQIIDVLGSADPDFAFDHMVADYFGLGDTKLCFEYLIKEDHRYALTLGLRATLPTRIRMAKGIIGAYFDVDKNPKSLDLHADVLNPYQDGNDTTAENNLENFLLNSLDHLATLLLEQSSRNHFHVGIGPQMHSTMHFSSKCYLTNLISLELFTPAQETRFFLIKNDQAAFDAFNWADPSVNVDNKLAFLNKQLKEKFFPPGYSVSVSPGILLQSTSGLVIKRRRATITLGTDFWLHSKESFGTIYAPESIKPLLDIEKAKMGNRYQSTLWIGFDRTMQPGYKWNFGIKASTGTWSSGIGASSSFALYIEKVF